MSELNAVGIGSHDCALEVAGGPQISDTAMLHDQGALAELFDFAQVVGGDDYGLPCMAYDAVADQ